VLDQTAATNAIHAAFNDLDIAQNVVSVSFWPGSVIATIVFNSEDPLSVVVAIPIIVTYQGALYVAEVVNPVFSSSGYGSNTGSGSNSNSTYSNNNGGNSTDGGSYSSNNGGSSNNNGNTWDSGVGNTPAPGNQTFTSNVGDATPSYVNFTINGHTYQISTITGVKNATQSLADKVAAQGVIALALATGTPISAEMFCTAFPEQCDCAIYSAACPAGTSKGTSGAVNAGIGVAVVGVVVLVAVVAFVVSRRGKAKLTRRRVSDSSIAGLLPSARATSGAIRAKSFADTVEV